MLPCTVSTRWGRSCAHRLVEPRRERPPSLLGLTNWQLVNFPHKLGETVRQRLPGIVPFPQPSPDFRQDLRSVGCIIARQ
jgi:hypothetical protein